MSAARPITNLTDILKEYKQIYNGDPNQLVNAVPPSEMWRLFIDFDKQGEKKIVDSQLKFGWTQFTEYRYLQSLLEAFQFGMLSKLNHTCNVSDYLVFNSSFHLTLF